jgi:tagatose 6-phosphate kinase
MAGGKGINVARVARTLGHHSEIGGFLGGYIGQYARSQYDADNLIGHYVWYEGETRLSILINEPDGRSTVFNDAGMPVDAEHVQQLADKIKTSSTKFDWVSQSGSIPPGAPTEAYNAVLQAARPAKVALDSHGKMLQYGARLKLDLLRINGKEAGDLLGYTVNTPDSAGRACRDLYDWGNPLVAISMGEQGAVAYDGGSVMHFIAPTVPVISNVGAGDAMFAGLICGLMEGKPFVEAMRMGIACGTAGCMVQAPGYMNLEDMRAVLPRVEVRYLTL